MLSRQEIRYVNTGRAARTGPSLCFIVGTIWHGSHHTGNCAGYQFERSLILTVERKFAAFSD